MMKLAKYYISIFWLFAGMNCSSAFQGDQLELEKLDLPDGFNISVFAKVPGARSMCISPSGVVYVGTKNDGRVFAVEDVNKDGVAEQVYELDKGLTMPNGVAFQDGHLIVAEVSRILRYPNIENSLNNPPAPEVIFDGYPKEKHHGWKYIAFGPDGKLYVPVGAPCNVCARDNDIYATITRLDIDNPKPEVVARGVRNSVGFDWDPGSGDLWFTDNGRDMMGDDIPPCELNHLSNLNEHFGFPYCHGGTIADPEFGKDGACNEFTSPSWKFNAHVAPLGMKFYTGNMFPKEYKNAVFVAQHGSWNRSKKIGYRVMIGTKEGNRITSMKVFASGWLDNKKQKAWGRPVALLQLPDGSLLLSDDHAGVIYRITYKP